MTDRVPLDHLTSDLYDALCAELDALRQVARGYCPACGRGDAAPTVRDWERERQRAEQAEERVRTLEAAEQRLAKVRDLHADLRNITGARWIADILDTILHTPRPAATQATDREEQPNA